MSNIILKFNKYIDLLVYSKELIEKYSITTDEEQKEKMLLEIKEIKKVQQFIRNYRVMGKTREVKELMFDEYKRNLSLEIKECNKRYDAAIEEIASQEKRSTDRAVETINELLRTRS